MPITVFEIPQKNPDVLSKLPHHDNCAYSKGF